jgi:hypothetical protein
MSKLASLAATGILVTTAVVHADPPDSGPKDPDTALMLSLGGTAASVALVVAGGRVNNSLPWAGLVSSVFTPSLGEWYAGKPLTVGIGIRAASAGILFAGIGQWNSSNDEKKGDGGAGLLVLTGIVGYAAGAIYDIADAPRAAHAYNRTHSWQVAPTVLHTPSGDTHMGIGIGGSF